MFRSLLMQRVTVLVLREDGPAVAVALARTGAFSPEAPESPELLPELPGRRFSDLYRQARSHFEKIVAQCPLAGVPRGLPADPPREAELAALEEWLRTVWLQCSNCDESRRRASEEQLYVTQLTKMLDRLAQLGIDFSQLSRSRRFLDIQIGMVQPGNVARLREALSMAGYVVAGLQSVAGLEQVVIAGPAGKEPETEAVLRAADWQPVRIPARLSEEPGRAHELLFEHQQRMIAQADARCRNVEVLTKEHAGRLLDAARILDVAAPYAELGGMLSARGGLAQVGGWAPADALPGLREALGASLGKRFVLSARSPHPNELARVPTLLRHAALLRPFAALVSNYGVPRYREIDPTVLFAVTFIVMFGMMFGDIGNGALIAAAGFLVARRLHGFAPFVVACGLASAAFGWVYGSVFGVEELVHPLWISPLADPDRMLVMSLYWGAGFILIASALMAYNRISDGRYLDALLDGKGAAGIVFYTAIFYGVQRRMLGHGVGSVPWMVAAGAFMVVFAYHWFRYAGGAGERMLVALTQVIHDAVGYFSNTLSFLRVAAFGLNHMALAIAVSALASMLRSDAGRWTILVFGNIFIVVLEGGIVAIQALRLEYYEGFSRFFEGSGREFRPLTLPTAAAA